MLCFSTQPSWLVFVFSLDLLLLSHLSMLSLLVRSFHFSFVLLAELSIPDLPTPKQPFQEPREYHPKISIHPSPSPKNPHKKLQPAPTFSFHLSPNGGIHTSFWRQTGFPSPTPPPIHPIIIIIINKCSLVICQPHLCPRSWLLVNKPRLVETQHLSHLKTIFCDFLRYYYSYYYYHYWCCFLF